MNLVQRLLKGDRRALARLISLIENDSAEARAALTVLYPHTGRAHIVGVTGAPGTGKSSLVNELAKWYRGHGQTVGIIAVDPTSPFSGGALLGDRIRMQELAGDAGIFIRSMASRGSLGGLAWATADVVKLLDAAGYEKIFVETVGAGQTEVDIARTAHTTLVVMVPGLGDDIQAIKAGLLEIADLLVVNKADRQGADAVFMMLKGLLELSWESPQRITHHDSLMDVAYPMQTGLENAWKPPICKTVATSGEGISGLAEAIETHWTYLKSSGRREERERLRVCAELESILRQELMAHVMRRVQRSDINSLVEQVIRRQIDPYSAIRQLLASRERW